MEMEIIVIYLGVFIALSFVLFQAGVGKRGKPVQSDAREIVCNVQHFFADELDALKFGKPTISVTQIMERTSAATGLSRTSVYRMLKEKTKAEESGAVVTTPGKKRPNRKPNKTAVDSFKKAAIRRTIYGLYKSQFLPSLNDINQALKVADIFDGSRWALRQIMKGMDFHYAKNNLGRKFLMEKLDVLVKRWTFLRRMEHLRNTGRPIIYLDETWVNVNHTNGKIWVSEFFESEQPLRVPLGKGSTFIILHAGTSTGFVPNSLLLSKSKSTKDYHEEMDGNVFKEWFCNQLVPNIPENSIIVMDNAPYHSVEINKAPVSNSPKKTMQDWLRDRSIDYDERATKPVLYGIIKKNKDTFRRYEIDSTAELNGHTVVRLPPFHCEMNAIELIWAQIKNDVAKHNVTFQSGDVSELFHNAINRVTPENWRCACEHVKNIEEFYREKGGLIDEVLDSFGINLEESDSDNEFEDCDNPESNSDSEVVNDQPGPSKCLSVGDSAELRSEKFPEVRIKCEPVDQDEENKWMGESREEIRRWDSGTLKVEPIVEITTEECSLSLEQINCPPELKYTSSQ